MNEAHTDGRYNQTLSKFQWVFYQSIIRDNFWASDSTPNVTTHDAVCVLHTSSGLLPGNCSAELPFVCQKREPKHKKCQAGKNALLKYSISILQHNSLNIIFTNKLNNDKSYNVCLGEREGCPEGFFNTDQGSCYKIISTPKTWDDANLYCISQGLNTHLAMIETESEFIALYKHFSGKTFNCILKLKFIFNPEKVLYLQINMLIS